MNRSAKKYVKVCLNLLTALAALLFVLFVVPRVVGFFMPFVVGWIIALIANPLVRFLDEKIRIRRKAGSAIVIIAAIALVIGAGDGGVVRELTRYPEIEQIDLVEIDQLVVEVCKKYLPQTACRFDDPRVQIHYEDGLKFVRTCEDEYDLIIVDSTDPFGPGEGLFTREFYGNCYKALKEDGIMVNQHESPFYDEDATACQRAHKRIVESFPISRVYQAHIPTYPSGHWLFGFASKKYHPLRDLQEARWNLRGLSCKYYTTTLHKGAFYLPAYVEELLKNVE